jgi:ribosomal protein L7/L12
MGVKDDIEIKVDTTYIEVDTTNIDETIIEIDSTILDASKNTEIIEKEINAQSQNSEKLNSRIKFEVSAGLFKNKENADKLSKRMNEVGFKSEIKLVNGLRRVYVSVIGADEAEAMSKRIEQFTGDKSVYFDENGISNRK